MRTIALRFSDQFAPFSGTIEEHMKVIKREGFAWYGKLGAPVSDRICDDLLKNKNPRILLIQSGKAKRYWAYIDTISKQTPSLEGIPEYYRDRAAEFHTWFRVRSICAAEKNVMAQCVVESSGTTLSLASKSSMSPYFIIDYTGDD